MLPSQAIQEIKEGNLKPVIEFKINSTSCTSVHKNEAGIWNETRIVSSYRVYIVGDDVVLMEKFGDNDWSCKQLWYGHINEAMIIKAMSDKIKKLEDILGDNEE